MILASLASEDYNDISYVGRYGGRGEVIVSRTPLSIYSWTLY